MVQGRSLTGSELRYITISIVPGFKFYGVDRLDKTKKVYVFEGPIDSMVVENAIATGDSDFTRVGVLGLKDVTLVFDNEPRNKEIVKQIEKAIDMGFNICLFPESIKEKDINQMVMRDYYMDLPKLINENTFSGLRAKLEFSKWRKNG